MKSFYRSCVKSNANSNSHCPNNRTPNLFNTGHSQASSVPSRSPKQKQKNLQEECKERYNYARKCGRPPPDDCYDIKLALGDTGKCPLKFSGGDNNSQLFHLCDNEVISLANTCGEITLSRQCLDNDGMFGDNRYQNMKNLKKQKAMQKKIDKKRGKERYKECKKNAKQIKKKYKDREKMRATNEKDYFKRCLKLEKQKLDAAKQRYKEKKAIAKTKMKENKKKNKKRLKKLNERLKQRCEESKVKDPNDPKSDSDTGDSINLDDPMDWNSGSALPCETEVECFSLTNMLEKPVFGCRAPNQVCVGGKSRPLTAMGMSQGVTGPLSKRQATPCKLR